MHQGQKPIFHLEAFVAKFMSMSAHLLLDSHVFYDRISIIYAFISFVRSFIRSIYSSFFLDFHSSRINKSRLLISLFQMQFTHSMHAHTNIYILY